MYHIVWWPYLCILLGFGCSFGIGDSGFSFLLGVGRCGRGGPECWRWWGLAAALGRFSVLGVKFCNDGSGSVSGKSPNARIPLCEMNSGVLKILDPNINIHGFFNCYSLGGGSKISM